MKAVPRSAILFFGLVAGLCLSEIIPSPLSLLFPAAMAVALYISRRHVASLFLLCLTGGWAMGLSAMPVDLPAEACDTHGRIQATVDEVTEGTSSGRAVRMTAYAIVPDSAAPLRLPSVRCYGRYPDLLPEIGKGDTIAITGYLTLLPSYSDFPGQPDYTSYLRGQGVTALAEFDWEGMHVFPCNDRGLRGRLDAERENMVKILAGSDLDEDTSSLLCALILGDTSMISRGRRDLYTDSGLAHVLAISGLHIGIIMAMISGIMTLIPFFRRIKADIAVTLVISWMYVAFLGFPPAVTRAAIMISLVLAGRALWRIYNPLHALFLAGSLILIFDPRALFQAGFQLSFAAVAGILLFSVKLNPVSAERHPVLWKSLFMVTVPLSATLATLPFSAFWFGKLPVYFIPANVALIWLMPLLLGCGIIYTVLALAGFTPAWTTSATEAISSVSDFVAESVSSLPASVLWIGNPGVITAVAYLLFLISLYFFCTRRIKTWGISSLCFLTVSVITGLPSDDGFRGIMTLRSAATTDLLLVSGEKALIIPASPADTDTAAVRRNYERMLRNIGVNEAEFSDMRVIGCGNLTVAVADRKSTLTHGTKSDVLLVDRHYRGTFRTLVERWAPDTILISTNIHKERAQRLADSCRTHAIPFVDMRERGWKYQPNSSWRASKRDSVPLP